MNEEYFAGTNGKSKGDEQSEQHHRMSDFPHDAVGQHSENAASACGYVALDGTPAGQSTGKAPSVPFVTATNFYDKNSVTTEIEEPEHKALREEYGKLEIQPIQYHKQDVDERNLIGTTQLQQQFMMNQQHISQQSTRPIDFGTLFLHPKDNPMPPILLSDQQQQSQQQQSYFQYQHQAQLQHQYIQSQAQLQQQYLQSQQGLNPNPYPRLANEFGGTLNAPVAYQHQSNSMSNPFSFQSVNIPRLGGQISVPDIPTQFLDNSNPSYAFSRISVNANQAALQAFSQTDQSKVASYVHAKSTSDESSSAGWRKQPMHYSQASAPMQTFAGISDVAASQLSPGVALPNKANVEYFTPSSLNASTAFAVGNSQDNNLLGRMLQSQLTELNRLGLPSSAIRNFSTQTSNRSSAIALSFGQGQVHNSDSTVSGHVVPLTASALATSSMLSQMLEQEKMEKKNQKKVHKRNRKGEEGRPKRPLTAYNLYFKEQRRKLIAEFEQEDRSHTSESTKQMRRQAPHGKLGFEEMGRTIAKQWRELSPEKKAQYEEIAVENKRRYKEEIAKHKKKTARNPDNLSDCEDK